MSAARKPSTRLPVWLGLWPGLPQLWLLGSWSGLAAAVGFGVVVDFVLATTLVWTEIWTPTVAWVWRGGAAGVWLVSVAWWIVWGRSRLANDSATEAEDLYPTALTEYLRGNHVEAERLLTAMLRRVANDPEALLLRASICRRTGRLAEARRLLDGLSRTEAGAKWQFEIERERKRLEMREEVDECADGAVEGARGAVRDAA